MENNTTFTVVTVSPFNEEAFALFTLLPFDSFEEKEDSFDAYIESYLFDEQVKDQVFEISKKYGLSTSNHQLENENWNKTWESNFQPVEVDDFVRIRADFHESKQGFVHELTIQPKMAFGTGHHQTTFMMVQSMKKISFDNKKVLDYGCGTGILAILAEKLGAEFITAVDNEYPSYENTLENAEKNNCNGINTVYGTLKDVVPELYDIVLANINRNVLLDTADLLASYIKEGGILLISGILIDDFPLIVQKYTESLGFKLIDQKTKDNWMCLYFSN